MKRLFKWALYLCILVVVLVVAGVLLLNTMVKAVVQSRLRSATGMEVKIGKIDIGLRTPTIAIEDFKLFNAAQFGGSPFLDMPEVFVEYDKEAIRAGQLHFKLVRVNIAEIDVIQDKEGRLNIKDIQTKSKAASEAMKGRSQGLKFTGIDTLNLTFQKLRISNLDKPGQVQEVNFNLTNEVFPNIKTEADLQGMAVILAGRSAVASPTGSSPLDLQKLLQQLLKP